MSICSIFISRTARTQTVSFTFRGASFIYPSSVAIFSQSLGFLDCGVYEGEEVGAISWSFHVLCVQIGLPVAACLFISV